MIPAHTVFQIAGAFYGVTFLSSLLTSRRQIPLLLFFLPAVCAPISSISITTRVANRPGTVANMHNVVVRSFRDLSMAAVCTGGVEGNAGQVGGPASEDDGPPLTSAGKHANLGEFIGRVVHEAIKGRLARQNNLTPANQCSAKIHLERFGLSRAEM